MPKPTLPRFFCFVIGLIAAGAPVQSSRASNDAEPKLRVPPKPAPTPDCAELLTVKTEPVAARLHRLLAVVKQIPANERENVLRLLFQDESDIHGRETLLTQLASALGFGRERDQVRLQYRKLKDEDEKKLKRDPLVRRFMRDFGSQSSDFKTPPFLAIEMGHLLEALSTPEQQAAALAIISNPSKFSAEISGLHSYRQKDAFWMTEALEGAFHLLGHSQKSAEEKVRSLFTDPRRWQFFFRSESGRHIFAFETPEFYKDYARIPAVAKFIAYVSQRWGQSPDAMKPAHVEEAERMTAEMQAAVAREVEATVPPNPAQNARGEGANKLAAPDPAVDESVLAAEKRTEDRRRLTAVIAETREALSTFASFRSSMSAVEETKPMLSPAELAEARTAADSLVTYFSAIEAGLVERSPVVRNIELTLLAHTNLLLLGPTGVAKTLVFDRILGGIQFDGKSSYGALNMHPDSTADEVLGHLSMRKAWDEDVFRRNLEEGMLLKRYLLWDEVDRTRPKLLPVIYSALNERVLKQAHGEVALPVQAAFGTANTFVSQFYLHSRLLPQEVQPWFDRWDIVQFVPGDLELVASIGRILNDPKGARPVLDGKHLDTLHALLPKIPIAKSIALEATWLFYALKLQIQKESAKAVEKYHSDLSILGERAAPFRGTRSYSPRTFMKCLQVYLPALALQRWIRDPSQKLEVTTADMAGLVNFLTMTGVTEEQAQYFQPLARDVHEASQYDHLRLENRAYEKLWREITGVDRTETPGARTSRVSAKFQTPWDLERRLSGLDENFGKLTRPPTRILEIGTDYLTFWRHPERNLESLRKNYLQIIEDAEILLKDE